MTQIKFKNIALLLLLYAFCYILGGGIAMMANAHEKVKEAGGENWGLGFPVEGQAPTATATADELKKFDTYYIGDTGKKEVYLTFDAGYENGYTSKILVTILITIRTCPVLVPRKAFAKSWKSSMRYVKKQPVSQ